MMDLRIGMCVEVIPLRYEDFIGSMGIRLCATGSGGRTRRGKKEGNWANRECVFAAMGLP